MTLASRQRGFSLIELLVCLAIVAVLALIASPLSEVSVKREKEQQLRAALVEIRMALDAYKAAVDDGRIARSVDQSGYPPSLKVLVDGVTSAKSPERERLYFLRRIPRDPFADQSLLPEATWGKRSYKSPPNRPTEGEDVYDVYSMSTEAGLNGIPYRNW